MFNRKRLDIKDRNQKLENIANSIHAASKIRGIKKSAYRSGSEDTEVKSNFTSISEMLDIIGSYSPDTRKDQLGNATEKTRLYSGVYKDMKEQLQSMRNKQPRSQDFIKTISLVRPVIDSRSRSFIDKLIKIYDILNS